MFTDSKIRDLSVAGRPWLPRNDCLHRSLKRLVSAGKPTCWRHLLSREVSSQFALRSSVENKIPKYINWLIWSYETALIDCVVVLHEIAWDQAPRENGKRAEHGLGRERGLCENALSNYRCSFYWARVTVSSALRLSQVNYKQNVTSSNYFLLMCMF